MIPLMLLMGIGIGAVMGFFITYLKVQPFIATLAGMWFARGMSLPHQRRRDPHLRPDLEGCWRDARSSSRGSPTR